MTLLHHWTKKRSQRSWFTRSPAGGWVGLVNESSRETFLMLFPGRKGLNQALLNPLDDEIVKANGDPRLLASCRKERCSSIVSKISIELDSD